MITTENYNETLKKPVEVLRVIGQLKSDRKGPSLIFIGGIHGNEPSGVFALQRLFAWLENESVEVCGNIYGLAGNLWALKEEERYHTQDLNRLWNTERIHLLEKGILPVENQDVKEQVELYTKLREILEKDEGPFYFIDLHSTSSTTIPFIVVNDSLLNRKFTSQYPLPMILGIEEYLHGPLLSYINELGYVAFGFEGGQHNDPQAVENHLAFCMLSLVYTGVLKKKEIDFDRFYKILASSSEHTHDFFEILYRYKISENENFKMAPGFVNFQSVKKGELLATSDGKPMYADRNARVFMPLYQSQGREGFFAIRKVPRRFLKWSAAIRRLRINHLLPLLPGVQWADKQHQSLKVNRKVARFLTKDFFHLMGYRSRTLDSDHYLMKNREAAARNDDYKSAEWY